VNDTPHNQTPRLRHALLAEPTEFARWIAANPPPDIQAIVRAHGTYTAVPEEAWREYLKALRKWQAKRQYRLWERPKGQMAKTNGQNVP
jgi:hypothetical protein